MAMIRRKIRWATKRRKCGSRVWKSKWVTIYTKEGTKDAKPKVEAGSHRPAKA